MTRWVVAVAAGMAVGCGGGGTSDVGSTSLPDGGVHVTWEDYPAGSFEDFCARYCGPLDPSFGLLPSCQDRCWFGTREAWSEFCQPLCQTTVDGSGELVDREGCDTLCYGDAPDDLCGQCAVSECSEDHVTPTTDCAS